MTLPRGRIITLSPYTPRQWLPFAIHRGDVVDITVNWVRFMRLRETPAEVLSAATVAGQGVTITNVSFSGNYVAFTVSGVQTDGEARISIAVSTNRGRTLSRSLLARTVWEDTTIAPVVPDPGPGPDPDPEEQTLVITGSVGGYSYAGGGPLGDATGQTHPIDSMDPESGELFGNSVSFEFIYDGSLGPALVIYIDGSHPEEFLSGASIVVIDDEVEIPGFTVDFFDDPDRLIAYESGSFTYWAFAWEPASDMEGATFTLTITAQIGNP